MNKLSEAVNYPLANPEAQAILDAAQQDAGFDKMLKFKKGDYYREGEVVPIGTEFVAHAVGWTKTWIKFKDGAVVKREVYRVLRRDRPLERHELDETDEKLWPKGLDGSPSDPWVFQYLLPMEDTASGDVNIFVTSSFGGRRAVADLCSAWARKASKMGNCGQPIVKVGKIMMPTRKFGNVPRPNFEIIGWDGVREGIREVKTESLKNEMDDDIPF